MKGTDAYRSQKYRKLIEQGYEKEDAKRIVNKYGKGKDANKEEE